MYLFTRQLPTVSIIALAATPTAAEPAAKPLMMPTLIRHPMMMLPIVCTAGVSGFVGGLLNIKGASYLL
jgi:uncharacterized membrane protein